MVPPTPLQPHQQQHQREWHADACSGTAISSIRACRNCINYFPDSRSGKTLWRRAMRYAFLFVQTFSVTFIVATLLV
jgi:hypothetical protein